MLWTSTLWAAAAFAEPRRPWAPEQLELDIVERVVAHRDAQRTRLPFAEPKADPPAALADLHEHQFSELGFGGRVVNGGKAPCHGEWHGLNANIVQIVLLMPKMLDSEVLSDLIPHCKAYDVPSFDGWTHEQYAAADLKSAHDNGLQLIVNYAVSNTVLCALSQRFGRSLDEACDDDVNIDRQIAAMWEFAEHHDWYRIAVDPVDAAQIVDEGDLAVVLGVETADYFATPFRGGILGADGLADRWSPAAPGPDVCHPALDRPTHGEYAEFGAWTRGECAQARQAVRHLEVRGVTAFAPVHEWNTPLSGAAVNFPDLFQPAFGIVNSRGVPRRLSTLSVGSAFVSFASKRSEVDRWPTQVEVVRDPTLNIEYLRNQQGLTPLGRAMLVAARDRNLVVDLAHVSERGAFEALAQFDAWERETPEGGPMVLSSHVTPRSSVMWDPLVLEYGIGDGVLASMAAYGARSGRMAIGLRTVGEPMRSMPWTEAVNCLRDRHGECVDGLLAPGDAGSLVQNYEQLRHLGLPIGAGTDMNGAATQTAPQRCFKRSPSQDKLEPGPCPLGGDAGASEPNRYARRGLATVSELPFLVADLGCLYEEVRPHDEKVKHDEPDDRKRRSCPEAFSDPTVNLNVVCDDNPELGPLCQSARSFVAGWAGRPPVPGPLPSLPSTWVEYGASPPSPPTAQLVALHDKARVYFGVDDPPRSRGGQLELLAVEDRAASEKLLAEYGLEDIVDVTGAGEFVVVDRRAARLVLRELRKRGLLGATCVPLKDIVEEAKAKGNKR